MNTDLPYRIENIYVNYQERIAKSKEIAEQLLNGATPLEIEMDLSKEYYGKDVKDLMFKADKEYKELLKPLVRNQMYANVPSGTVPPEYPKVNPNLIAAVEGEVLLDEKQHVRAQLRELIVKQGYNPNSVSDMVSNPFVSADEKREMIFEILARKAEMDQDPSVLAGGGGSAASGGGTVQIVLGFVVLLVGLGATMASEGSIFYGAMIVGAIMIFKGFAAKLD